MAQQKLNMPCILWKCSTTLIPWASFLQARDQQHTIQSWPTQSCALDGPSSTQHALQRRHQRYPGPQRHLQRLRRRPRHIMSLAARCGPFRPAALTATTAANSATDGSLSKQPSAAPPSSSQVSTVHAMQCWRPAVNLVMRIFSLGPLSLLQGWVQPSCC